MILLVKRDREVFNYDTTSSKFYYCQDSHVVKGPASWNWEFNIREGNSILLSANCLGVWYG